MLQNHYLHGVFEYYHQTVRRPVGPPVIFIIFLAYVLYAFRSSFLEALEVAFYIVHYLIAEAAIEVQVKIPCFV